MLSPALSNIQLPFMVLQEVFSKMMPYPPLNPIVLPRPSSSPPITLSLAVNSIVKRPSPGKANGGRRVLGVSPTEALKACERPPLPIGEGVLIEGAPNSI